MSPSDTETRLRDSVALEGLLADAKRFINYDPETGIFTRVRSGAVINDPHPQGYLRVSIRQRTYLAHRVAWLLIHGHWPSHHIDHINGVKTDNRIANLRAAEVWQNRANSRKSEGKTSRLKGVSYKPDTKLKWEARIRIHGKQRRLGRFATEEEAHEAYMAEARRLFGEFARAA